MNVQGVFTDGKLTGVQVNSFQISVTDRYDWIGGALANVPLPEGVSVPLPAEAYEQGSTFMGYRTVSVKDSWMQEVEKSGGAKSFGVVVEPFKAPPELLAPVRVADSSIVR